MEMTASSSTTPVTPVTQLFDPFGIFDSCARVQQAWLNHPAELLQTTAEFGQKMLSVGQQTALRCLNLESEDVVCVSFYDERFQDPLWFNHPFSDFVKEIYLLCTHWLEDNIFEAPGVEEATRKRAAFWVRQVLNALAPSNFFHLNPKAQIRYVETGGKSLHHGFEILCQDIEKGTVTMVDEDAFVVGQHVANTPGKVIFRNQLIELIQYQPTTDTVNAVPIVFVPPWINKYYILDINPKKSLIKYLVDQGHSVFTISWKNPNSDMRNVGLDDYVIQGIHQAIEVAQSVSKAKTVHPVGYCIGGTALAMYLAWANANPKTKNKVPVADWTTLCSLVDFSNPGDIDVFIDEAGISEIENIMKEKGYLDGKNLGDTFRMLRSNSLIWHYVVHHYLYGEDPGRFDILYWNIDSTRMPEKMHSAYLRDLYLNNRLVKKNTLRVEGTPIDLKAIKQPLYTVGTEQDHITPWQETYKVSQYINAKVRYILATSGHIVGVLSPPVNPPKRRYWAGEASIKNAEAWRSKQEKYAGSWWEDWTSWLGKQCADKVPAPKTLGSSKYPVLEDAPGTYVKE